MKSGGEWISSVELENAIMAHPKVVEAAVIGVPHERWVERPLACVVVEPGETLTAEELRAHLEPLVRAVVAARRRGVHRRGAQDQRRQVLQAHPAGEVRRLRIARSPAVSRTACTPSAGATRSAHDRPDGLAVGVQRHPPRAGQRVDHLQATAAGRRRVDRGGPGHRAGPGVAHGDAQVPRSTPTERVLSDRAWSTAFATSSVITIAASWARSSPMPHSCGRGTQEQRAPARAPWRRRAGPAHGA